MLAVLVALLAVEPSPSPKPRPTPVPVLEGRVQGPDGKPIADALVVARSRTSTWAEAPLSARTDATGAFRLTLKSGALHDVWAEARGLAVATRDAVRPGSPLIIRLEAGGVIEGVVRDSSGAPVEGARVDTEPNDRVPAWLPGAGTVTATTDRNGRFRLTGLDRRPHALVATARGYGTARQRGVLTGGRAELFLVPGAGVNGVVVDAEGRPLADVVVRLEAQQHMAWLPSACATDARGGFAFDGLAPGSYALVARHPEHGLAFSPGIEVGAEGDVRRDVILLPGVAVTGRLVDPEEMPVSGRVVVGEIAGEAAPRAAADALSADAGADGRFRIEGVPLGPAALNVTAPRFSARRLDFDARPGPPGNDLGDVAMDPGLRLRGHVRSRAGVPVAEAQIFAHQRRGTGSLNLRATSDDAGAFVIGGLQPGRAQVSVAAQGFAPLYTGSEAGATDLELVLDPAGSITGMVVDEKGAAVPSFRVSAERGDYSAGDAQDEFSPADGRFVLENVGEGLWTVSVSAPGHAPAAVPDVAVRPGRASDVGRIRLSRGATVRGQVVTSDDSPVAGATIQTMSPQPMAMNWGDGPTATADASGLFELAGVTPGLVDVIATHPSYAANRARGVEADPGRVAEVRLVLGRGGRIEGTARRRDGASLAGAFVHVRAREGGFSFEGQRGLVGPDGSFAVERVPAGPMRVALLLPGGGGQYSASASRDVEVREGETVTVDLAAASILVSGHVTRGGPVAGARVNFRTQGSASYMFSDGSPGPIALANAGPERGTALTDEEGAYQLLLDGPGAGWASVEVGSPPSQHFFGNIEVPDADTFSFDFAIGAASISGTVVDSETNAALADAWVAAQRGDGGHTSAASRTGPDGRFRLEVEPGDYTLSASHQGYADERVEVEPGAAGLAEMVIALDKGLEIRGRLVDARGNGQPGVYVTARSGDATDGAPSVADGHFRITGLPAGSLTLFAAASGLGFARAQVTAPAEGVLLQLAAGGRVSVRAVAADGSPAKAVVQIEALDGLAVSPEDAEETDAQGMVELDAPAGVVTLRAWNRASDTSGRVTVAVPEGQTVTAEITLKPPEKPAR